MRKRLISSTPRTHATPERSWLDLEKLVTVEVTSEAEGYPIEGALLSDGRKGWRASEPGTQTIRLLFDHPLTIHLIHLLFREDESSRTQEFVLRWLPYGAGSWKEIVRQQWNFSPPDATQESEEYKVDLASAAALELSVNPDISQSSARASLERLQLTATAS
jgi:hypothetical protein